MKRFNIFFFLISILLPCVYISIVIHKSYVIQASILGEINSNTYTENTYDRLQLLNLNFPNISVTTLPMSGILAKYHYAFGNIKKSLDVIDNKTTYKDHIYYSENLKAIIFNELNIRDSSIFYSEIAHKNLPGNANHYEHYVKNLVFKKDSLTLINSFNQKTFKNDFQFAKIYLAACLSLKISDEKFFNHVQYLENLYSDISEVKLMIDYAKYGENNIKEAVRLANLADNKFDNNEIEQALDYYIQATKLNPSQYTNFENAGFCFFKLDNFNESIPYFKKVIDSLNPGTGKSEYLLGISYFKIGNNNLACRYLYKSQKFSFKQAFLEYGKLCK